MSETDLKLHYKNMTIPHVVSTNYVDLTPRGFLFMVQDFNVRIIYYHEEPRPLLETVDAEGNSTYQTTLFRVQDVSVTITIDDFVRLTAANLRSIEAAHPGLLEKYQIKVGG